jgi:hypothetical protein
MIVVPAAPPGLAGGDKVATPRTLGSKKHKPGVDAPDTYVLAPA